MSKIKSRLIQRRYAKALMGLYEEPGAREELGRQLDLLIQVLDQVPALELRLDSELLARETRVAVAVDLAARLGLGEALTGFLVLLVRRGRVENLRGIQEAWQGLQDRAAGVVRARVSAASPLDPQQQATLEQELARLSGAKVICQYETDASLLGGCVVRMEDLLLDGSLSGRLARLRRNLLETHPIEG
jgi:F-type H+-transporting ATPase subunit delta